MDKIKQVFSHSDKSDSSVGTSSHHTTGTNHHSTGVAGATSSIPSKHVEQVAPAPRDGHVLPKSDTHLAERDAANADHDHQHLAAVTHQTHQRHEVEEVERERHVDRHLHHVQHHVQPVLDTQHAKEQHHENIVAPTKITEKHVNTDADSKLFSGLASKHKDDYKEAATERVIVDKGEKVTETAHHHVHHVIQPVIERDTHEHHVIHTKVPIHHESHEAPVVHQSVEHQPMQLKDFVAGGGDLKSKLTHDSAGVLQTDSASCARTTDGPLESLKEKLHLGSTKHDQPSTVAALQK